MPFLTPVDLRAQPDSRWLLLAPLVYQGATEQFTVPAGITTDLASVPDACTWAIARYGAWTGAAVVHDHLCQRARLGLFSRHDADGIFRRVLGEVGVPFVLRYFMWCAVRLDAGLSGATASEVALWLLWAVLALPVLLISGLVVWPAQQLLRLVERF